MSEIKEITAEVLFVFHRQAGMHGQNTQRFAKATNIMMHDDSLAFDYVSGSTGLTMRAWFKLSSIAGFSMSV